MCYSDLSILMTRHWLDKCNTVVDIVSADKTTSEKIKSQITDLMNTTDKEGGKNKAQYIR